MGRVTCAAMVLVAALIGLAGAATAQGTLSPGCQRLNDPEYDGHSTGGAIQEPIEFFGGEQLSITASPPAIPETPDTISLQGPYGSSLPVLFDEAPFPGTLTYTFPTTGLYSFYWQTHTRVFVEWTVSCQAAAPYPLAVATPAPGEGVAAPESAVASNGGSRSLLVVALATGVVVAQVGLGIGVRRRRIVGD